MSKDLNKVLIIGRLGKDVEGKYLPKGSFTCRFTVASGRRWTNQDGTQGEDTEWFNIEAWDKLAETCTQYLAKGARVYIEGRLKTESWDDTTTGQKRYFTKVIANDMIMLEKNPRAAEAPAEDDEQAEVPMSGELDEDVPMATAKQLARLQALAPERGVSLPAMFKHYGITQLGHLTEDQAGALIERWSEMPRVNVATAANVVKAAPKPAVPIKPMGKNKPVAVAVEDEDLPF